jgi:hypothetical protein
VTNQQIVDYVKGLGLRVEVLGPPSSPSFIVIRDYVIPHGRLTGRKHDVAIQWQTSVPYVPPAAIHVHPHVVPMGQLNSQASPLGAEWQYLSRVLRVAVSPSAWIVHINTVFAEL